MLPKLPILNLSPINSGTAYLLMLLCCVRFSAVLAAPGLALSLSSVLPGGIWVGMKTTRFSYIS